MLNYEDIMMKMADGIPLTQIEKDTLRRESTRLREVSDSVKAWQNINGKINDSFINFPISTIYSSKLTEDTASIDVQIPSIYSHLILIGSGKTSAAVAGQIAMRFNGDSGNNYSYQYFQRAGTTTSGEGVLSLNKAPLGVFLDTAGDELGANFFSVIPHYRGAFYKSSMTLTNYRNISFRYVQLYFSFWNNTSPISKITFIPESDSIKAGSLFSIYGLV